MCCIHIQDRQGMSGEAEASPRFKNQLELPQNVLIKSSQTIHFAIRLFDHSFPFDLQKTDQPIDRTFFSPQLSTSTLNLCASPRSPLRYTVVKPQNPSPSPFPIPQKNGTRKGWLSAECFIFQKNKSPSLFHWCPFRLGILQFNNLPTLKLLQSGSTVQRASAQYSSTKSTKKQISQYQTIFQEKTLRHSAISSAQHCGKPPEQSHHDLPISKTTHNPSNKYIAFSIIVCSGFLLASLYPRASFAVLTLPWAICWRPFRAWFWS